MGSLERQKVVAISRFSMDFEEKVVLEDDDFEDEDAVEEDDENMDEGDDDMDEGDDEDM